MRVMTRQEAEKELAALEEGELVLLSRGAHVLTPRLARLAGDLIGHRLITRRNDDTQALKKGASAIEVWQKRHPDAIIDPRRKP